MPKNIYRDKFEQLQLTGTETLKNIVGDLTTENEKLKIENAGLRERLRMVEIAARGE